MMATSFDYKRFAILYVDDEINSLKYFNRTFQQKFRIFTAPNAKEGFRIFQENKDIIGILMCDQRMPGDKGVDLLEKVAKLEPKVQRILVTAYSDLNTAIDAVNKGSIYHYITKPWDIKDLEIILKKGLEFAIIQREKDRILYEKISLLHTTLNNEKIVSLSNFLAGLNHHIRNALVPIKTFLDLTPEKLKAENVDIENLKNSKYWVELYATAQSYVNKINLLIQHLDLVLKPTALDIDKQINLADIVNNVSLNMTREFDENRIKIEHTVEEGLPTISGDSDKLAKLFTLLLKDELINLPENSHVRISLAKCEHQYNGVEAVIIEISDDGPGIPSDSLGSIFDPLFIRSKDSQEFGVNLVNVFVIVHNHGGRIEVAEKNEQEGVIFRIFLPVDPIQALSKKNEGKLLQDLVFKEITVSNS